MDRHHKLTEMMTEDDLLDACRAGNRDAFAAVFRLHQRKVFSVAIGFFGGDQSSAEDVTQQVFLKLYTSLDTFRGEAKLATWLYRVTINSCLDEHRKRKKQTYVPGLLGLDEMSKTKLRVVDSLEREIADDIQEAIGILKTKFRLPILLKYSEGLSYKEMANVLGCSEGTIASRLNRGHKILARKLKHLRG